MRLPSWAPIILSILLPPHIAIASEASPRKKPADVEQIDVIGESLDSADAHIKRAEKRNTDIYAGDDLRRFGAQTLADAVAQTRGVDTQTFCANCGAKRISINGLKGEHTSILIDGIPLHSTVSSFYGIDAVPVVSIEKIEVKRGAGAALIAPESIGGSINLITTIPEDNMAKFYLEAGNKGSQNASVLGTYAGDLYQSVLALQYSFSPHWDIDNNKIAESPERENHSAMLKIERQIGSHTEMSLRLSRSDLDIVGGNTEGEKLTSYTKAQATPEDFLQGDVRNRFIGDIKRISEYVDLSREEAAFKISHVLSPFAELSFSVSKALQDQKSFYSHAFDYENKDEASYADVKFKAYSEDLGLSLTLGAEYRHEKMDTASDALFVDRDPPLPSDRLKAENKAIYLMGEFLRDNLEIEVAVRLDQVTVLWDELGQEISETIVAPRFAAKYSHTHHLTSRFAYGLGYRTPLTLFESSHGSNHNGFLLDIDEVEKAHSAVYSFSANFPSFFITSSAHWTKLMHMAYGRDRAALKLPILYENSSEDFEITVFDIFFGGKFSGFDFQVGGESFQYEDSYANKLPTAAIEKRLRLDVSYTSSLGVSALSGVYVAARDLSRYRYDEHYNIYNIDINSQDFGKVTDQKRYKVPAYYLLNFSHSHRLGRDINAIFRVNNVLDFTQTKDGDSPTAWHWHKTHAHFDNFHTWGPLSGREYFAGLEVYLN